MADLADLFILITKLIQSHTLPFYQIPVSKDPIGFQEMNQDRNTHQIGLDSPREDKPFRERVEKVLMILVKKAEQPFSIYCRSTKKAHLMEWFLHLNMSQEHLILNIQDPSNSTEIDHLFSSLVGLQKTQQRDISHAMSAFTKRYQKKSQIISQAKEKRNKKVELEKKRFMTLLKDEFQLITDCIEQKRSHVALLSLQGEVQFHKWKKIMLNHSSNNLDDCVNPWQNPKSEERETVLILGRKMVNFENSSRMRLRIRYQLGPVLSLPLQLDFFKDQLKEKPL